MAKALDRVEPQDLRRVHSLLTPQRASLVGGAAVVGRSQSRAAHPPCVGDELVEAVSVHVRQPQQDEGWPW